MIRPQHASSPARRWLQLGRAASELLALFLGAPLVLLILFAPAEFQRMAIQIFIPASEATIIANRGAVALAPASLIFMAVFVAILALLRLDKAWRNPASGKGALYRRGKWLCLPLILVCGVAFAISLRPHYRLTQDSLQVFTTFHRHDIPLHDVTTADITLAPPGGGGQRRLLPGDIRRSLALRTAVSDEVIQSMIPADIAVLIAALPAGLPCTIDASEISRSRRDAYIAEVQQAIRQTSARLRCLPAGSARRMQP